jgi:protein TonB
VPPELEEPPAATPAEASTGAPENAEYTRLAGDEPKYPRASKRLGEQGDVVLGLRVDDAGFVVSVELRSSSGFRRLDQSAMGAALTWRFPSGTPTEIKHTVHFVLQP